MERTNELLYEVINSRLEQALSNCKGGEKDSDKFMEAMDAYDRHLELLKIEDARIKADQELKVRKMEAENAKVEAERELELKRKEGKRDSIIKAVEIAGIILITPLIEYGTKKAFAQMLCLFEKDYTFTTIPGRSLNGLFRFKK
ncbi:MAG: hypothetical protein K9L62_01965 [Vallitaleaceae bacterium]|nr:hypothetical protein [Vallitaleaceae bacterium]